jgi:hypothetical protein
VIDTIADALRGEETVNLPLGTFEVLDHTAPPLREWFLNRVRVTYRKRSKS